MHFLIYTCANEIDEEVSVMGKSLAEAFPDIAVEWSEKNLPVTPDDVSYGTHKKYIWKGTCGHEWSASVKSRTVNGSGCPYCSHNKVLPGFNDLASQYPDVAAEWSEKNYPLRPDQVTPFRNEKVWWKGKCGHEWYALISSRSDGHGCPYCKDHKLLPGFNDFASRHPDLAAEWSDKNLPLTPDSIPEKALGSYWWKCSRCGGEYQAWLTSRLDGSKCPYCSGQVVQPGLNDLATTDPEVAAQWNYERNKGVLPSQVFRTSKAVRWWKGTCGHEWKAKTADRTVLKSGCPVCNQIFLAFLPKLLALRYTMMNGIEVRFDSDRETGLALEIVIPELNMVIESEKKGKQAERIRMVKQHICREHSLRYITIPRCATAEDTVAAVREAFRHVDLYLTGDPASDIDWARERYQMFMHSRNQS